MFIVTNRSIMQLYNTEQQLGPYDMVFVRFIKKGYTFI